MLQLTSGSTIQYAASLAWVPPAGKDPVDGSFRSLHDLHELEEENLIDFADYAKQFKVRNTLPTLRSTLAWHACPCSL